MSSQKDKCIGCEANHEWYVEKAQNRLEQYRDYFGNIIDGWVNVVRKSPEVELVAAAREGVCKRCEHLRNAGVKIGDKVVKIEFCGICKCPIMSKTRSMGSECDDGRWRKHLKTL